MSFNVSGLMDDSLSVILVNAELNDALPYTCKPCIFRVLS